MRIVILGGAGFLGKKLAHALLDRGYLIDSRGIQEQISKLVVFDKVATESFDDVRLETQTGDITDPDTIQKLFGEPTAVVFHLAAVVSGEAEKNFDLGMKVNLEATINILEACRKQTFTPRFLFASSIAVFGGDMPEVIQDGTALTPQSSYGTQKAMAELLVNDYSRKGFIDGRVLRLPTIVVRPGKPNQATSSFASSIIREPLQDQEANCPVSLDTKMWIMSPRQAIKSFIQASELQAEAMGQSRILALPGLSISVDEMIKSLEDVAGNNVTARIHHQHDGFIQQIVGSWPAQFAPKRALALGFQADASVQQIIQNFLEDDLER